MDMYALMRWLTIRMRMVGAIAVVLLLLALIVFVVTLLPSINKRRQKIFTE